MVTIINRKIIYTCVPVFRHLSKNFLIVYTRINRGDILYSNVNDLIMKKYILFLVVTFICLWKVTIANAANDGKTVTVEITKDTTIYVRHLFKDVKLYADFGTNGGNFFDKNNKSLNPKNHVYVLRDKEKTEGIRLVFKENDIKERQIDVKFYGQDSEGNCLLSDIYTVIVNIKPQTVKTEKPSNNNLTTPEKSHDEGKDKNIEISNNFYIDLVLILFIVLLFVVGFICVKNLNKKIASLEIRGTKTEEKEIDIEQIKKKVVSGIKSAELANRISDDDIYKLINSASIQTYIQNMVAKKVEEIVSERMNELNNGIMQEAVVEKNKVEKIITEPILQKEFKKKYADFCFNGNNEAIIEIRDLGENSKFGMFTIIFDDSSVAKYTINPNTLKSTLEDIAILNNYAIIDNIPPKFSSIKVLDEGEMSLNGKYWKVTKKIKIELI